MIKDFEIWNGRKILINQKEVRVYFHEREVWWSVLGVNVGFEQDGKGVEFHRPVLVFKKFNNEVFWGIPLSTRIKKSKFYSPIKLSDNVSRVGILSQLRLMDAKRLLDKIGVIDEVNHSDIQKAITNLVVYNRS